LESLGAHQVRALGEKIKSGFLRHSLPQAVELVSGLAFT
jgi:hypothetical protein